MKRSLIKVVLSFLLIGAMIGTVIEYDEIKEQICDQIAQNISIFHWLIDYCF